MGLFHLFYKYFILKELNLILQADQIKTDFDNIFSIHATEFYRAIFNQIWSSNM